MGLINTNTLGITVSAVVTCICALVLAFVPSPPPAISITLGVLVTAVLPGYVYTFVIFRRNALTLLERLMLGMVLSISATSILAYSMNIFFHVHLTRLSLFTEITVFTLVGALIALVLQKRNTNRTS
jgi:uncharacterized membrane protein